MKMPSHQNSSFHPSKESYHGFYDSAKRVQNQPFSFEKRHENQKYDCKSKFLSLNSSKVI